MSDIKQLAAAAGIETSYVDVWGNKQEVGEETLQLLLTALGIDAAGEAHNENPAPVYTLAAQQSAILTIPGAQKWSVSGEKGEPVSGDALQERIIVPPLEIGYYTLTVNIRGEEKASTLLVSPPTCWLPEYLSKGHRVWGISAQLYALRSECNMGIGDFGDLKIMAEKASAMGTDVIGLNPVSALFSSHPGHYAPYAPSSRLFLNTQYIDVTAVDGFDASDEVQRLLNEPAFKQELQRVRDSDLVDYPAVAALKSRLLELLFTRFSAQPLPKSFRLFTRREGEALKMHATFEALCEYFQSENKGYLPWQQWPDAYRDCASPEVKTFAKKNARRLLYFMWLQWLAHLQLERAQETALSHGMKIGLYRDLAVGVDKAGAELWMNPNIILQNVSIGAPSDEYNPQGQNWGLPPLHPTRLRQTGYRFFRDLLRANMQSARALRIDHAFGLCRLFLIPEGKKAGAYVHYAFDEMLAVLKIESHRNHCLIIGEDLGTFPPEYKQNASDAGLFSYKLLYFERDAQGDFIAPEYYPPLSLATLSTHDLPTYRGWLQSADIEERAALHLYPSAELLTKDRHNRPRDIERLTKAITREGIAVLPNAQPSVSAVEDYLARSAAGIVMVQLEDVLGVAKQVNIPTTTDERPNWRMKLPQTIEHIMRADGALQTLSVCLNASRRRKLLNVPRATYRLQFHKEFTFDDAVTILPYLAALGISHIYASPYFSARPGSHHGYDITNHSVFNSELGGEEGFNRFIAALQSHNLHHIVDFVPNHMGVGGSDNTWWLSVLEWGRDSPFAPYFDIDWQPRSRDAASKLILPFLGEHYGEVLAQGKLQLKLDKNNGSISLWYGPHCFPICPKDYPSILAMEDEIHTPHGGEILKQKIRDDAHMQTHMQLKLDEINKDAQHIHALLERQHYRLAYWRVASSDINYRRFFDITDLAGIRPEMPELFQAMHEKVLSLAHTGKLQGLRIDHIDGLADPERYCRDLREKLGAGAYLIVEKILAEQETLPQQWPVQGTSGYDALTIIGGIFADKRGEKTLDRIYRRFTGIADSFSDIVLKGKMLILETTLASELQALSFIAKRVADRNIFTRDYTRESLKQAIKDIIAYFPVYRTYITAQRAEPSDIRIIDNVIAKAKKHSFLAELSVYDFLGELLTLKNTDANNETLTFMRKFQQLSGPVMAKGVEDTSFYRYNRLLSLNEVGGNPAGFGMSISAFHRVQAQRAKHWPHSMIATATHDTKRGEDMRMRITILSEIARDWGAMLMRWSRLNRSRTIKVDGWTVPSRNEEYFIYQTLLGSIPNALLAEPFDKEQGALYTERVCEYMIKALREAKYITSWNRTYETYENAVTKFIKAILDSDISPLFLKDFIAEARRIAQGGAVNSIAQTILKCTLPGVPDIYQGSEQWDLSLVDPDNRRPVDYASRKQMLAAQETLGDLLAHWQDGAVKQRLLCTLLTHRAAHPALYAYGNYEPVPVQGMHADRILAYSRIYEAQKLIAIVPVKSFSLEKTGNLPLGDQWQDTQIELACDFHNLLDGASLKKGRVRIAEVFSHFPAAVLFANESH